MSLTYKHEYDHGKKENGLNLGKRMVATVVYDEYLHELNWPLGGAIALVLLLANLVVMLSYNRLFERRYKNAMG